VILASGLRCFVRGQWTALLVVTALKLFNLGPSGVSKFTAAAGLGSIVAVALTSQLIGKVRLGTATAVAFIACGAFISLVGLTNSADIAYGFVVCWGIAMAVADSTSFSVLYRMSDPVIRAKTVGVLESVKFALEGIGAIVAPLLVYLLGIRGALIAVGFPLLLLIAISWRRIHAADAVGVDRSKIVNLLYQVPALHVPDMSLMEDVASRVTPMQYRAGGEIICEGEEGDRFYVIASGTVQVSMSGYPIGDLGPGGSFGERALLRNARRSATVTAVTDTSLLTLSRSDFLSATQGGPQRGERVGRSAEGNAPKSVQWTPKLVAEILADQILFGRLTTRSILDLAHAADVSHWAPGSDIIVQGDPGEAFYVILEGRTRVAIDGSVVNELHPGDAFGEISLLHDVPRRATVTAVTSVTVCTLTRQQFALGAQHLQTSGGVAGLVT
jgi:CRP-like cAMP-binding protein